jgi:hypothetical protein
LHSIPCISGRPCPRLPLISRLGGAFIHRVIEPDRQTHRVPPFPNPGQFSPAGLRQISWRPGSTAPTLGATHSRPDIKSDSTDRLECLVAGYRTARLAPTESRGCSHLVKIQPRSPSLRSRAQFLAVQDSSPRVLDCAAVRGIHFTFAAIPHGPWDPLVERKSPDHDRQTPIGPDIGKFGNSRNVPITRQ